MMSAVLELPLILNVPPKLLPAITSFNNYTYLLAEGGRGSGKSHTIARMLLYIAEKRKVRIVCGREIQANIEESVYTILKDLIEQYNLAYDVFAHKIVHKFTKSKFTFKGFREQGSVSVKGMEGVDILWIDEAQSVAKTTLDIIIPTIMRNAKARILFSMNRFMRDDPVFEFCAGRPDCLHIKINYNENPFCSLALKNEAEIMRNKSERDFKHIWLGEPLSAADDYLFNWDKLHASFDIKPFGEVFLRQRVMGIDFAAQGNDQCVASILDRLSNQHWGLTERIPWDEPDTMVSVGKIVDLVGRFKPDVLGIDIGGMGKPVYDRLIEVLGHNPKMQIIAYDGGSTAGVDTDHYANIRAAAYFLGRDWFDNGWLCIERGKDTEVIKQLEKIRFKYRSNGVRIIQAKVDMKKDMGYSPDDADSVIIAIWVATHYLGRASNSNQGSASQTVSRKSGSARHKG